MPCGATGEGREGPGHYLPHHCHNNHHGGKGGEGRIHVHHESSGRDTVGWGGGTLEGGQANGTRSQVPTRFAKYFVKS